MGYRTTEHTADIGIEAWGESLERAFEEAARGMFSLMVDLDTVAERTARTQTVHGPERADLLVGWLNDLIGLVDSEGLVFRRFVISSLTEGDLTARSYGEPIDPARHSPHLAVKAATYHRLAIDDGPPARVRIVLDI